MRARRTKKRCAVSFVRPFFFRFLTTFVQHTSRMNRLIFKYIISTFLTSKWYELYRLAREKFAFQPFASSFTQWQYVTCGHNNAGTKMPNINVPFAFLHSLAAETFTRCAVSCLFHFCFNFFHFCIIFFLSLSSFCAVHLSFSNFTVHHKIPSGLVICQHCIPCVYELFAPFSYSFSQ